MCWGRLDARNSMDTDDDYDDNNNRRIEVKEEGRILKKSKDES